MKTKILFIVLIILLASCKKKSKEETTVEFVVVNDITGEAFANVDLAIYETANISSDNDISFKFEYVFD
jgi:hypothetical protein